MKRLIMLTLVLLLMAGHTAAQRPDGPDEPQRPAELITPQSNNMTFRYCVQWGEYTEFCSHGSDQVQHILLSTGAILSTTLLVEFNPAMPCPAGTFFIDWVDLAAYEFQKVAYYLGFSGEDARCIA